MKQLTFSPGPGETTSFARCLACVILVSEMIGPTREPELVAAEVVREPKPPSVAFQARNPLTPRELEVLHLMADGLTTKAIADQLKIRFKTAACHRSRILEKLGVSSSVSAVRWAIRQGIVVA